MLSGGSAPLLGRHSADSDDNAEAQSAAPTRARVPFLYVSGKARGTQQEFDSAVCHLVSCSPEKCNDELLRSMERYGAANLGSIAAQAYVGGANDAAALWLLDKAAERSCEAVTNYNWGCVLATGAPGRPKDLPAAVKHLRRAAALRELSCPADSKVRRELELMVRESRQRQPAFRLNCVCISWRWLRRGNESTCALHQLLSNSPLSPLFLLGSR